MKSQNNCSVHVFTEWGPLEEIIVGNAVNFNLKDIDYIFSYLYQNKDGKFREKHRTWTFSQCYVEECQEDLDNLQRTLEELGVVVRRPEPLQEITEFRTPFFESCMTASDSVRDPFLLIGNDVIETPPTNHMK